MLIRLIAGVGLFAFGYYLGKQVGRMEPIRDELARERDEPTDDVVEPGDPLADDRGE